MNQFRDLIEGKSVAVVGRGTYLGDVEQAAVIDSHDVVARIHSPLPHPHHQYDSWHLDPDGDSFVPKVWQSRIGTKTQLFRSPTWFRGGKIRFGRFSLTFGGLVV